MIRRFFRLILSLFAVALLVFLGTTAWIVTDGLTDLGIHADVAIVPGHKELENGVPNDVLKSRLDRVAAIYKEGDVAHIVVSGATGPNEKGPDQDDEADDMAKYLQDHDVPATAIIEDKHGTTTDATAHNLAGIMKDQNFNSLMIVTHYYHITRLKLALRHAGVFILEQTHTGKLQKEDASEIGREVIAVYYYLTRFYVIPAAQSAMKEIKALVKTVEQEVKQAKNNAADKMHSIDK